ncbi:MAG: HD-GYP domain-containing protein [Bryobacteraceae bacterium]
MLNNWPAAFAGAWNDSVREPAANARVLVVDDLDIHLKLVEAILRQDGVEVVTARNGREALSRLDGDRLDLVVVDAVMPGMDGAELCRAIRSNPSTKLLPVLMLASLDEYEAAGIAAGADEFLQKPYTPQALRMRVHSMLRQRAVYERLEESESILFSLAVAVEQRDPYTAGHCERLALFSLAIGLRLNLQSPDLLALYRGGFLHDIGKVGMPDSILFKPGPLCETEWAIMRTHSVRGEAICQPLKCLRSVLPIIRNHHERWNGTGYPDGIRGEAIPLLARILKCADVFDALTTERPYKMALTVKESLRVMQHETDEGWLDPSLMQVFLSLDHELLQSTAHTQSREWKDLSGMKRSLENLNFALA